MSARRLLTLAPVLVLLFLVVAPVFGAPPKAAAGKIDPKALTLLSQMEDYLSSLGSFSVHIESARDVVSPTTQVLTSDQAFDVSVERPNHFRIHMTSAAGTADVIYSGKNLIVYSPSKSFYAVQPAPPTIRETLQAMARRGIEMPLVNIIQRNPSQPLSANLVSGVLVGTSVVNGVEANQLAFRGKNVDWQVWISNDPSAPLPVRLVIDDKRVSGRPRYVANLSGWSTSPTFDAGFFSFTPPPGAQKIDFSKLPRPGAIGTKPAVTR